MFKMFNQIFTTVAIIFAALEKFANALSHLGTYSEEQAGAFSDEARINRRAKMKALREKTGVTEEEVPTTEVPVIAAQ